MITYDNDLIPEAGVGQKYAVLFADATQDLIAADIASDTPGSFMEYEVDEDGNPVRNEDGTIKAKYPITTLEQYFSYLPKLLKLENNKAARSDYEGIHSKGRRYTMLPLTEPAFVIDANKRTIDVPAPFKSGVSVKGDQLAEVLYFEIDRFFDAMDLDTADIYIQWTKANGESGVSAPWVVDIESIPDKMIIGWALSSTITEIAGQLKFAVRFFKWADPDTKTKLAYSWSTETQTVSIKNSLDFALGQEGYLSEIQTDADILDRISKSKSVVVGNQTAAVPVYQINISANEGIVKNEGDDMCYADLAGEDQEFTFKVQAKSTDAGIISYTWRTVGKAAPLGGEGDTTGSVVTTEFIPTTDTVADPTKAYYKKETNGVYKLYKISQIPADSTPANEGLFEKFSACTVKQVGTYYAVAQNDKTQTNSNTAESDYCMVPMPIEPKIDTALDSECVFPTRSGSVTIGVGCSNTETENNTKPGELTYEWFRKKNSTDEYQSLGEAAKDADTLEIEYNSDPEIVEGYYKVKVTNSKNRESVSIESSECRVTYPAEIPVIAYPTNSVSDLIVSGPVEAKTNVHITLDEQWINKWNVSDKIEYQWYKTGDKLSTTEDDNILIEGATESAYQPKESGSYFCKVTNIKSTSTAETISHVFSVTL